MIFEFDPAKERINLDKHGVGFSTVPSAFSDPARILRRDKKHSGEEVRFQCTGFDGHGILTFTFTLRAGAVRVINAGYWRKGKRLYEHEKE